MRPGVFPQGAAHHTGSAVDLLVWLFKGIVGTETSPVFTGGIVVGQRFLNAILLLLGGLFQLHKVQFLHYNLSLFRGSFSALLSVDRPMHLGYWLHLGTRRDREYIAIEVDGTPLDTAHLERDGYANLQCGHTLSCSAR